MREIKFRGKRAPNSQYAGEWVKGNLVVCDDGSALIVQALNDHNTMTYHVKPDSVGQYIGICDTSTPPKEIYDGDIIEGESGVRHLIQYNEEEARFEAVLLPLNPWSNNGALRQSWVNEFKKRVVGNKFDNHIKK